jgi:serine/threonine-protein kinase RsbW
MRVEPKMLMESTQDSFQLDSQLSELSRVQPWIEALADQYGFGKEVRFAMQLCMEEALANVVMHGYGNEPGHPIVIRSFVSANALHLAIDDKAPPFAPVEPDLRSNANLESVQPRGNGLRLLYRFAGSLAYERLPDGNRLTIGFPLPVNESV